MNNDYEKHKQLMIARQSSLKSMIDFYKGKDISFKNLLKATEISAQYVLRGLTEPIIKNCDKLDDIYPVEEKD